MSLVKGLKLIKIFDALNIKIFNFFSICAQRSTIQVHQFLGKDYLSLQYIMTFFIVIFITDVTQIPIHSKLELIIRHEMK